MLILNGGTFRTTGGNTADYENYNMPIHVTEGKVSGFEPFRNCYVKSKVSGAGTLDFNIYYVREYLQGDWSQFSGTLNAKGLGTTTDGNQLMLNNNNGIPNGRVVTSGNTKIVCWKNASTMYLGGLSGSAGTYLSGSDKQNNAATMTWIVGGAGTNEAFHGIINNECSNRSYNGTTSIIKEGDGFWRLTGANVYKGTTTVRGGMLVVNGRHTGTGKVTVTNEATLAGIGTLPSVVEIQSGGTLHVGDPTTNTTNVGTMTVGSLVLMQGSQTNMEVMRTTLLQSDRLAATGTVTLGGTLNIDIKGTVALTEGDQFTLFSGTSVSGKFQEMIPATPGAGLAWEMTGGVLKVIKDISGVVSAREAGFSFGPNPVSERLTLQTPETYAHLNISLINSAGSKVVNETASGNARVTLNTSALAAGIYFLRIDADDKPVSMDKVIKLP
jgi:autotransporter-associated beta strand protein